MLLFSNPIRIIGLFYVLLVFYFPLKIVGTEKKCFKVEGSVLCYFSPNATSLYGWEEARAVCRERGATLPHLPNKVIAGVLERYLESQNVQHRFWTSGRRIESNEWRWIDGQSYNGRAVVKRSASDSQAILRRDFTYLEQNPVYEKNYVCQHFGSQCKSIGAIQLSYGCLVLISKELRNVSFARNSCLERGADLPVIRNNEDPKKFEAVFLELKDHAQIWLGLRRHWWIWDRENGSTVDVRLSNWAYREGSKLYNNCMVVDAETFKWRQVNCSDEERVICQTVVPEKAQHENISQDSSMGGLVAGILIGILIVAVAVVIAVLVLRKRIRLPFDGFRRVKCTDSPIAKPNESEELRATASADVIVTTSSRDQGHYIELNQRHTPESSRGHYDKLNHLKVESRRSHNVEPRQRQNVDLSQSRKSEPCPGYKSEPSQGQVHGIEMSTGQNIPQSHKVEPDQRIESCQGQMDDQFQDHYAKIAADDEVHNEDDEQPKTIVYAKLEFDAGGDSKNLGSNDQRTSTEIEMSPSGVSGSHSRISQQTSIQSSIEPDRISMEAVAQNDTAVLQNGS